jgi:hypothetical protein
MKGKPATLSLSERIGPQRRGQFLPSAGFRLDTSLGRIAATLSRRERVSTPWYR